MPLDPHLAAQLAALPEALRRPPVDIHERRALALQAETAFWDAVGLPLPETVTEDLTLPVEGAPDVLVRLYRRADAVGTKPGVISLYGGGFRQGGLHHPVLNWMWHQRAFDADIVTIGVDYARAPEHPYPAAARQVVAVIDYFREHGAEHGIGRLAINGHSAGGNLAAVGALARRDALELQFLEVPSLDLTRNHGDLRPSRELGLPDELVMKGYLEVVEDYFGKGVEPDPAASPLLAEDLTGAPPAYILMAEYDPLRGDGSAYFTRLREAGVPASAMISLGQSHESAGDPRLLASRHWHLDVVAVLRTLHG